MKTWKWQLSSSRGGDEWTQYQTKYHEQRPKGFAKNFNESLIVVVKIYTRYTFESRLLINSSCPSWLRSLFFSLYKREREREQHGNKYRLFSSILGWGVDTSTRVQSRVVSRRENLQGIHFEREYTRKRKLFWEGERGIERARENLSGKMRGKKMREDEGRGIGKRNRYD